MFWSPKLTLADTVGMAYNTHPNSTQLATPHSWSVAPEAPASPKAGVALGLAIAVVALIPIGLPIAGMMFIAAALSSTSGDSSAMNTVLAILAGAGLLLAAMAITGLVLGIQGLRTRQRSLAIAALITLGAGIALPVLGLGANWLMNALHYSA